MKTAFGGKKGTKSHINDDRLREIINSTLNSEEMERATFSSDESAHLRDCGVCIDRFGNLVREIFEQLRRT